MTETSAPDNTEPSTEPAVAVETGADVSAEDTTPARPAADVSDAGLKPIRFQIGLLAFTSATSAVTDSLSLAGIAGLFAGSLSKADPSLGTFGFDWISEPWVVLMFVVVTFLINAANTVIRESVTSSWEAKRRLDLVRAYREASFEAQASHSGSALSVAAEQIGQASQLIGGISGLLTTVLRTIVYLVVAFVAAPAVSGVAVAVGGVLVIGLRSLTRRTRAKHRRIARDRTAIGEQIGEMTTSSRELHLLNRWDGVIANLEHRIDTVRHDRFVSASLATMVGPIYWAGTLLVGLILAAVVEKTNSNLGGLATSGILLIRALGAAQSAQVMYQTYNDAAPYLDRTLMVIGELRSQRRIPGTEVAGRNPTLTLEDVSLSYGNDVIAKNLDLNIGGIGGVGLVGPSGSGKSTTLLALSGFLAPSHGSVAADGIPLSLLPPEELGRTIGLLPQDPKLFRATLRHNISRPDTDADDDALRAALDHVGLTPTVSGFHDGLESEMGRGGEGFSGGEVQRFGLARLEVNQPRVWLLDEPTSALDKENSGRVAEIITRAMEDHLVVVVTHRPELLTHCSRIIFMENGVILDDGTLEDVAARQPFVASMIEQR